MSADSFLEHAHKKDITIKGKDGSFGGYLASPASGKGPGVVIIQEIFGINPWMRSVAGVSRFFVRNSR